MMSWDFFEREFLGKSCLFSFRLTNCPKLMTITPRRVRGELSANFSNRRFQTVIAWKVRRGRKTSSRLTPFKLWWLQWLLKISVRNSASRPWPTFSNIIIPSTWSGSIYKGSSLWTLYTYFVFYFIVFFVFISFCSLECALPIYCKHLVIDQRPRTALTSYFIL